MLHHVSVILGSTEAGMTLVMLQEREQVIDVTSTHSVSLNIRLKWGTVAKARYGKNQETQSSIPSSVMDLVRLL